MPKYLMFDHGGVLDGEVVQDITTLSPDDLILESYDWGGHQVLKKGIQIIRAINHLVKQHDFEVVFHSKNRETDQVDLLKKLQTACQNRSKGTQRLLFPLEFPKVRAIAVYDKSLYENTSSTDPQKNEDRVGD